MISKELLSEVLGYEVLRYDGIHHDYIEDGVEYTLYPLNIYELAHKCKEWALKQGDRGYIIHSNISHTFGRARVEWYEKNHYDQHNQYRELTFYSEWFEAENNNEPEAIKKACEWILDKRRKL